ncbi:MAG: hypothetical protein HYV09_16240 [Deltaproteobacteria bacterium]|nr:hypothetical protein [Deltaproteobacteria bacterium]
MALACAGCGGIVVDEQRPGDDAAFEYDALVRDAEAEVLIAFDAHEGSEPPDPIAPDIGSETDTAKDVDPELEVGDATDAHPIGARASWAATPGSMSITGAPRIAYDPAGNLVFAALLENDKLVFGSKTIACPDSAATIVAKLTPDGNVLWHHCEFRRLMTGRGLAVGPTGNVALALYELDLYKESPTTADDGYAVTLLDAAGTRLWSKAGHPLDTTKVAQALATFVAGPNLNYFAGMAAPGTDWGGFVTASSGFVLVRYRDDGVIAFGREVALTRTLWNAPSIAADAAGNVFIVGSMEAGTVDFGAGAKAYPRGVFLASYDSTGAHRFTVTFPGRASLRGVAVSGAQIVVHGAAESGVLEVAPGGTIVTSPEAAETQFAIGLDAVGGYRWHRAFERQPLFGDIALDASGATIAAGTSGSSSSWNVWLDRLDSMGNSTWSGWSASVPPTPSLTQTAWSVAVAKSGEIAIAGTFMGTLDFGVTKLTTGWTGRPIFLARLAP